MNATDTIVASSVKRLLAQHGEPGAGVGIPHGLWQAAVEAGLTRALIPEAGNDPHEALRTAVTILRECAYDAAPIPLAEAMLANWFATRAGWQEADGLSTVALECPSPTLDLDDAGPATAQVTLRRVPWGRDADAVYALIRGGAGFRIALLEPVGNPRRLGTSLADEPRDTLVLESLRVSTADEDPLEVMALAAILRAAQMTGAMERTLDLAVDHARTRVQFGRAIGGFQAVQQMLAQHASHVAAAAAAVDLAVDSWGTRSAVLHAGMAKSRASEAAGIAAECAHQVIAAMGYTMEHPLQRVTRRLWTWRDDYGTEAFWNEHVGTYFLAAGAASAWALIADSPPGDGRPS